MKTTDYTNKCGSCQHFEKHPKYKHGWCHKKPWKKSPDKKHPFVQLDGCHAKCKMYLPSEVQLTQPQKTNADHIRSMTDEELAKLFIDSPCHGMSCADAPRSEFGSAMCVECQLKWLKQPYKEEK